MIISADGAYVPQPNMLGRQDKLVHGQEPGKDILDKMYDHKKP